MGIQLTDNDVSECVGDVFDQAVDLTARFLADRADLSTTAAFTLNRVNREGPIRLTTLASREGISQPSMTQLVQRLERAGLVTRLPDPDDGRAALIDITDAGTTLLDERRRQRRERLAPLLASLSPEEQCALWHSAQVVLPLIHKLAAQADRAATE
ncbi:MarR family transcriptional regulator [Mycobacterium sp. M26]|uniref:MarR family winged helix-turn-helix transcriptional regulator n=1 Tax=Mycobacterium sp. M26 TaxID=1762962 RepID=UPI000A715CFA|nr:MarR family transcriptional regulator [Mycobacterium sp. M26]